MNWHVSLYIYMPLYPLQQYRLRERILSLSVLCQIIIYHVQGKLSLLIHTSNTKENGSNHNSSTTSNRHFNDIGCIARQRPFVIIRKNENL